MKKISWILYGRGTIDQTSIELIGQLLFWLSTGMIFSCLIPVLNAGLYAQKAYRAVFANMVTMAVLNFLLAYGLIETWWLLSMALSVSITALLAVGEPDVSPPTDPGVLVLVVISYWSSVKERFEKILRIAHILSHVGIHQKPSWNEVERCPDSSA